MSDMTKAELVRKNIFLTMDLNKLNKENRKLKRRCERQNRHINKLVLGSTSKTTQNEGR
jgi:hypothetical protein